MPITVDARGFAPSEIRASKGAPVTLVFTRTSDNTCAKEVVLPELSINKPLPLNEAVTVDLPPSNAAHTYKFQCGMAMYIGTVVIR